MNTALIYCSPHGRTRKVVQRALEALAVQPDVYDLASAQPHEELRKYDLLIVFCPTYGDEELPEAMENYILDLKADLTGIGFILCELGNYYGYDDLSFGAKRILRRRFKELGATDVGPHLSLDSMPKVDWNRLNQWIQTVNQGLLTPKT